MSITASNIAQALQNKRYLRTKQRTLTGVKPPKSDEVDYRIQLLNFIRWMTTQVETRIDPLLTYLEPAYVRDTPRQDILGALKQLESGINLAAVDFAERIASLHVQKVSSKNSTRLKKSFEKSFGISLPELTRQENIRDNLNAHIKENVELIKSLPTKHFQRLRDLISQGVTHGRTASDLRNVLRDTGNITERRARVIARDQTSKLNGNLTAIRAQNAGSDRYTWVTRDDPLVRPTHARLNGKTFYWAEPPDTGNGHNHPGEDIECRCYARIIIDI